jgi:hypothetical protein
VEALTLRPAYPNEIAGAANSRLAEMASIRRVPTTNKLRSKGQDMANASKKHIGAGAQGKSSGTGAVTDISKDQIEENMVLSNRDKSQHGGARGLDSKHVQTEQFQENETKLPKKDQI